MCKNQEEDNDNDENSTLRYINTIHILHVENCPLRQETGSKELTSSLLAQWREQRVALSLSLSLAFIVVLTDSSCYRRRRRPLMIM